MYTLKKLILDNFIETVESTIIRRNICSGKNCTKKVNYVYLFPSAMTVVPTKVTLIKW